LGAWNSYINLGYDAAGQLTNAWTYLPDGTPVTAEKWAYGYDAAQNLAKRTNNVTIETFTVNGLNQLTAVPDSTPTYDRRGNLITRAFAGSQTWSYSYDAESQLVSVSTDTSSTPEASRWKVEFVYDGQGRLRIKRDYIWSGGTWSANGETRYLYDGMLIVQERDSANTPQVTYTRGRDLSGSLAGAGGIGGLLARSHGYSSGTWSTHNFYHADGNGNITALVNSSHAHQASYKYDPYGRLLASSGTLASANVMRFSSKPWVSFAGSATSGLYYYGFRFADPYLQRWLNRDPLGERGGINLYEFAWNDPVDLFDRFGLFVKPTDFPPAGNKNTVICYNGKLTIQNKKKGPGRKCYGVHEYSHLQDWLKRYGEDVCKGQKNGTTPVGGDGYDEFLRQSECKAYKADKKCFEDLLKNCKPKDKDALQNEIDLSNRKLKENKCD